MKLLLQFCVIALLPLTAHALGNPENITLYGSQILSTNMGLKQDSAADKDGYISLYNLKGELVQEHYLPVSPEEALDSPMGMTVYSDVLYVADVHRVVGYSLRSRRQVFESTLEHSTTEYLNDLVAISTHELIVTSTSEKKVYLLNTLSGKWKEILSGMDLGYVNGIEYDSLTETLYVGHNRVRKLEDNNGTISAFSIKNGMEKKIWDLQTHARFLDGLNLVGNSNLLAADWGSNTLEGTVHVFDRIKLRELTPIRTKVKGLADLHYDALHHALYLVSLREGKLTKLASPFAITQQIACASYTLNLNLLGMVQSVDLNQSSCAVGLKSSSETSEWYQSTDSCQWGDPRPSYHHSWQLEIQRPRVPAECTSQVCDPSSITYEFVNCEG